MDESETSRKGLELEREIEESGKSEMCKRVKYCRDNFKARPQPLKLPYLTGEMPTLYIASDFKTAELIRVEMKYS